jgi:hypothetical protein
MIKPLLNLPTYPLNTRYQLPLKIGFGFGFGFGIGIHPQSRFASPSLEIDEATLWRLLSI